MKKVSLFLFVFVTVSTLSYSQSKSSIGVFGGLNIPRLSGGNNNELSRDYTSRSGVAFGLTSSLYLGSNFSLRIDVMYSSEGGKRNGIQAFDASSLSPLIPAGTYLYADFKNESILNYAEVPVLIKYTFPLNKSSKFFVNAGPYIGFLLNANQKTSGSSLIYIDRTKTMVFVPVPTSFDANTDIKKDINKMNIGLSAGVGLSQKISSGEVFIDVRGAYGLKVIQKLSQNGSSHSGSLLIDLGYALQF